jgi:hypothetical protein
MFSISFIYLLLSVSETPDDYEVNFHLKSITGKNAKKFPGQSLGNSCSTHPTALAKNRRFR